VALLLKRRGIERVRPLDGGLAAWRRLEYPLVQTTAEGWRDMRMPSEVTTGTQES
jgi:3-mercaptopyruvate sulfurtransferase SseA